MSKIYNFHRAKTPIQFKGYDCNDVAIDLNRVIYIMTSAENLMMIVEIKFGNRYDKLVLTFNSAFAMDETLKDIESITQNKEIK